MKAIENNFNENTFESLEKLKLYSNEEYNRQKVFGLIQALAHFCDRNRKQLFTFEADESLIYYLCQTKTVNGITYQVFFDSNKFEKDFGQKFEIPKKFAIHSKPKVLNFLFYEMKIFLSYCLIFSNDP
jgi:hypothetical protein